MENTNIVKSDLALSASGNMQLQINTFEEAIKFAEYVAKSPFAPKGMDNAGSVLVAMQAGAEIGLSRMQSLQSIGVINGRPGIYGDAALALVRASGLLEYYKEIIGGEGDNYGCKVTVKRKGYEEAAEFFTIADAKTAGLWGKAGPWTQYPKRMLKFRARGFILRDQFGDVLKGFKTFEELNDYDDAIELDDGPLQTSQPNEPINPFAGIQGQGDSATPPTNADEPRDTTPNKNNETLI